MSRPPDRAGAEPGAGREPGAGAEQWPPPPPLRVERALAAGALALICVISFANVVVRYFTQVSFAFTEEYSVVLLVVMTFTGAALAFANDRHIRMTFVYERLPPRLRRAADRLTLAVTTLVMAMIAWYGARLAHQQWQLEETSPGLGHPAWTYTVWLPLLALVVLARVWQRAWRRRSSRR